MNIKKILIGDKNHMPPNCVLVVYALFFAFVTLIFLIIGFGLGALLYPVTRDIGAVFRWFTPQQ
jgi:hypothetical protein